MDQLQEYAVQHAIEHRNKCLRYFVALDDLCFPERREKFMDMNNAVALQVSFDHQQQWLSWLPKSYWVDFGRCTPCHASTLCTSWQLAALAGMWQTIQINLIQTSVELQVQTLLISRDDMATTSPVGFSADMGRMETFASNLRLLRSVLLTGKSRRYATIAQHVDHIGINEN